MAIEEPAFKIVLKSEAFEVRQYAPMLVAETLVDGDMDEASTKGFRKIADYIFGNNRANQTGAAAKIAMTAPVEQSSQGEKIAMTAPVEQSKADGVYRVGFVVPRKYNRETVPKPTDPRVSIREVPARTVAVWRYSGRWTEENFREHEQDLRRAVQARGLQAVSGDSAIIARYDAPFIPWFMRRNEVLIPLERKP